jgi:hypothetical protein
MVFISFYHVFLSSGNVFQVREHVSGYENNFHFTELCTRLEKITYQVVETSTRLKKQLSSSKTRLQKHFASQSNISQVPDTSTRLEKHSSASKTKL